ncbi:STAS domain-containing protein [candidate division WOR-3 bacterium]|nr:STAS domain-containing protein [candidate division WOR-3 bacterium]
MTQSASIPILKLKEFLIVSIQTDLHDRMAEQLQYSILHRISETGAKGVLIDISALEMVDSFIGRTLADTAKMASTLDADIIIVGMQPAVAITLVELGLSLGDVKTAISLDEGYGLLEEMRAEESRNDDEEEKVGDAEVESETESEDGK